jgi:predicted dinucleotide-binding enzyme
LETISPERKKMRIGVIGSGEVGRVLGAGFALMGHEVKLGSRNPAQDKIRAWLDETGASAGTFDEAASFAEVAVLATLWEGTENAIRLAGPENLAGKVVIDATNPLDFSEGVPPKLAIGHTDSGGEQVQRWLPRSSVVKAFNTVGNPHMVNPQFPGGPPDMFICGNDEQAKQIVTDLLKALGWSVIDVGDIEGARYLEPLAMVWVLHLFRTGTPNHAFKLLTK